MVGGARAASDALPVLAVRAPLRLAWPGILESLLALAAIAALLPWFARLAEVEGRHGRFAPAALIPGAPPAGVLAAHCASDGVAADAALRTRLCGSPVRVVGQVTVPLDAAHASVVRVFERPLAEGRQRLDVLRSNAGADVASMAALEHTLRTYASRYALDEGSGPAPIACAMRLATARAPPLDATRNANATLLLAAALEGHPEAANLARTAALPDTPGAGPCANVTLRDALVQASALSADARSARLQAAKGDAMRALLPTAGLQWAAAMLLTLILVKLSRTRLPASIGCGVALLAWAAAAWAGGVPWPLAPEGVLDLGRQAPAWDALPAQFVIALASLGVLCVAVGTLLPPRSLPPPQTLASRTGLAGLVVATGVGWIVLLDLSATGPPSNRYLGLYHQGHLWLALLALTVLAFLRAPLGRVLAALFAIADEVGMHVGRWLGPVLGPVALMLAVTAIVVAIGLLLSDVRQLTSELGRVWLVVGVAWFFFLRGGTVAERLARDAPPLASLLRYAWPLMFVALVLAGAMVATRDMGPLLIATYGAGAFLAASVAMWWHVRTGAVAAPGATAIALFAAWIAGVTYALFALGGVDEVTSGRLENLAAPLASANDQLALVAWFRDAVPSGGFGPGAVPWCGFASGTGCAGVPAQIQSDYTFTALVGVFGHATAWILTLGCALWLHRLIAYHGHVTRGEPRLVRRDGRHVADSQAFVSWIGVVWVVLALCQLAVTVAGNLAVLPLTGVTFPFVSFGMTSLVVNCALFAVCLNVTVHGTDRA